MAKKSYPSQGTPIKVDRRALKLLNFLGTWLDEYQYRVMSALVAREVRRQGIQLPPDAQQALESLEADLELDPDERGRLKRK